MNFKFSNLLGAPYRGGNVILHGGTSLFTPVGNRVSVLDLQNSQTETLPFENGANIARIAVSPNGVILLSIDDNGRAIAVNVKRRVVLHHFSFKDSVSAIKFSPDGRYFAAGVGKFVQVWLTPSTAKSFSPFHLHRTYAACQDTVTCLDWSPDSQWIVAGSRDLTARIFSIQPLKAYKPVILGGHREPLVAVFFRPEGNAANGSGTGGDAKINYGLYTLSKDGALFEWTFKPSAELASLEPKRVSGAKRKHAGGSATDAGGGEEGGEDGEGGRGRKSVEGEAEIGADGRAAELTEVAELGVVVEAAEAAEVAEVAEVRLDEGQWKLEQKHFFMQSGAKLSAADYHPRLGILVACFTSGVFGIYQLPDFTAIHLLSISRERISTVAFNESGDWIAFGCAKLGQLLVWEWRSETYILKQQGHYFDVNTIAFSPDGSLLATGADDNKLKLWNVSSGFCFVTLTEHSMPITAVAFLPNGGAILSASLDGTVRAWDLLRYRNFRTFTAPTSTQFMAMALNPAGDIVCASSLDDFQIYVWSVKTGRLLDILSGHKGPVPSLAFSPTREVLASASWDGTVRIWDIFEAKGATEALDHSHDVMAIAFRPDGREVASATLDGQIYLWDPQEGELRGTIEGRRDVGGGRRAGDRQTAANQSSGKCFTCLSYTADGAMLLAAGSSKYVCCYDVAERVLLRRFEMSANKSLDGLLDKLNSSRVTDAGPLDLLDDADSEEEAEEGGGQRRADVGGGLPGAAPNKGRPSVRSKSLQIAPSGSVWAAATTEGVMVWRVDEGLVFDPADLDVDVTPQAVEEAIRGKRPTRALQLALRLNEPALLRRAVEAVPPGDIALALRAVPTSRLGALLTALAVYVEQSPHLEFVLRWCQEVCLVHRRTLEREGSRHLLPAMRAIQKGVTRAHEDLTQSCGANTFLLQFLIAAPLPKPRVEKEEEGS